MDGCWQAEAGTPCTYAGQAGTCQAIQTGGWLGNDGGSIQYAEPQCWVPPPPETFPAPSPWECDLAPDDGETSSRSWWGLLWPSSHDDVRFGRRVDPDQVEPRLRPHTQSFCRRHHA
jgi:hypothetical protein